MEQHNLPRKGITSVAVQQLRRWLLAATVAAALALLMLTLARVTLDDTEVAQADVKQSVGDDGYGITVFYCNAAYANSTCPITISAGETVTWNWTGVLDHSVTSASGPAAFDSGLRSFGSTFSVTFNQPGVYTYVCQAHPEGGGAYMLGEITVAGAVGGVAELPDANMPASLASSDSSGISAGVLTGLVAGAAVVVSAFGGAAWYRGRRWR